MKSHNILLHVYLQNGNNNKEKKKNSVYGQSLTFDYMKYREMKLPEKKYLHMPVFRKNENVRLKDQSKISFHLTRNEN